MKTFVRPVWAVPALVFAVFLAGCASPRTSRIYRAEQSGGRAGSLYDFQVVSASSERRLSTAELEQLEAGVQKFMASQGLLVRTGEYLIRIEFPPPAPGLATEWVLVRLTSVPVPAFSVAETYPAVGYYDYYSPFDYGYGYYDDPYGYYYPLDFYRSSPVRHHRDDDRGRGEHRAGDRHDPPGKYAGGDHRRPGQPPNGSFQPGHDHRTRTADYAPHSPDYGRGREGNQPGHGGAAPGGRPGGSSYTPPPPRHETTPAPQPAPRQETTKDATARDNKYK